MANRNGLELTDSSISDGESETRFVVGFRKFVMRGTHRGEGEMDRVSSGGSGRTTQTCGAVILPNDIDVTMKLTLAECLRGQGDLNIVGENGIDIDTLRANLLRKSVDERTLCSVYVLGGCHFTPGIYGVTHEHYFHAAVRHDEHIGNIGEQTPLEKFEVLFLLAYLEKTSCTELVTYEKRDQLREEWVMSGIETSEMRDRQKCMFTSAHSVGSRPWCVDVRNFVFDRSKSMAELVSPLPHLMLQGRRVRVIVFDYWAKGWMRDLTPSLVKGTDVISGFTESGDVLLETEEDLKKLKAQMQELENKCRCKGQCNSRQCSCVRRSVNCTDCDCDPQICENNLIEHRTEGMEQNSCGDFIEDFHEGEAFEPVHGDINEFGTELLVLGDGSALHDTVDVDENEAMSYIIGMQL